MYCHFKVSMGGKTIMTLEEEERIFVTFPLSHSLIRGFVLV